MKKRRQWSINLEERWYMAQRRRRAWEWADKMGIIPLDELYREFKSNLDIVRDHLKSNSSVLQSTMKMGGDEFSGRFNPENLLFYLSNLADDKLKEYIKDYLSKINRNNSEAIRENVQRLRDEIENEQSDPIILLYIANYFDKLAKSEKMNPEIGEKLRQIRGPVKVMLDKYKEGKYSEALSDLRAIIKKIESSELTMNDTAVTLAAVMHDLEIPSDMFERLNDEAWDKEMINKDDYLFLYLIDLREGIKYAGLVKEYLKKSDSEKKNIPEMEIDTVDIELLLDAGKNLERLSPKQIISEILPSLEKPVDKLKFIQEEVELHSDTVYKDPKNLSVLREEVQKIIRENPNDAEVKNWIYGLPSEIGVLLNLTVSQSSPESFSKDTADYQKIIEPLFKKTGGDDPFRVLGPIDLFVKLIANPNKLIEKIPLDEIASYMIAHPEHAESFLKPPSKILGGRNFQKEFSQSATVVNRMILQGGDDLHKALMKAGIATQEEIQRAKENRSLAVESRDDQSKSAVSEVSEAVDKNKVGSAGPEVGKQPAEDLERDAVGLVEEEQATIDIVNPNAVSADLELDGVIQTEDLFKQKAEALIKDIEGLSKNENIDNGRKREVGAQMSFFKSVIKKPEQAEKIIPALEGIRTMLNNEIAAQKDSAKEEDVSNKSVQGSWFMDKERGVKPTMDARDITGADQALDDIENIRKGLDQNTVQDKDQVREIELQLQMLFSIIENRKWEEKKHRPILDSVQREVNELKASSSNLKK